jgi:TonB family protein
MSRLRRIVVLALFLAASSVSRAQDFKQTYIGKDPCGPEVKGQYGDFSLRLDKIRNSELRALDNGNTQTAMIIEYKKEGSACGIVRDVVQITHLAKHKHFEFRCFDAEAPTDVVVGTVVRGYGNVKLVTATEAWRIDLKEQKFVETHHKVVCSADGWDGDDDGGDLVDDAKIYAAHGKPGQFASEDGVLPKGTVVTPLTQVTMEGKVIEGVQPQYPEEPLKNRLTGTVVLHVILQKDGTVRQVDVVSGQPVFAEAAVDAVRQWKNQPTVLNGEPVEVDTLVYVKFMLRPAQ